MFDVGFWEILLILVLALVIIGPERLPGAARKVGYFVGKSRRYIEGVRSEVEEHLDVNEFKRMMHNQEVQINELQEKLKSSLDTSLDTIGTEIKQDLPTSDILTDVAEHSFHDEKKTEPVSDSPQQDDQHQDSGQKSSDDTISASDNKQAPAIDKEKS